MGSIVRMMIRAEIGDMHWRDATNEQPAQRVQTVMVAVDVLPGAAKRVLDKLLTSAYDVCTEPAEPPF